MNYVSMGRTHIKDEQHKKLVEVRHRIIDKHTKTTHKLDFVANGDGSYILDTQVDERLADSPEYMFGMIAAINEIREIEAMAQSMAALDEATGGMLLPLLVDELVQAGIEVPQDILDLAGAGMITVIDKTKLN